MQSGRRGSAEDFFNSLPDTEDVFEIPVNSAQNLW